jgi:integrase
VSYRHLISDDDSISSENMQILLPPTSYQYRDTQITAFINWLDNTGRQWINPDMLKYKEYLIKNTDMSVDTINNAITAIRRRYHDLVEDGTALQNLHEDERETFLSDLRRRLGYYDQFPSRSTPVREMLEDDPYNQSYLTPSQVRALLNAPDITTFVGMRDRALLALSLATGIQQFEMARVQVDHLRHTYKGRIVLYVPASKQRAERHIPYDDYEWVLDWIDEWLNLAEITAGPVFRGTYCNRDIFLPHSISHETASDILARYPIPMHGTEIPLLFADLPATCARRRY